ncbi:MAG: hypothetical protein NC092_11940 [Butyrivibrio sp.]|nr:hypothetical protein [Muribaculum sp.]MCM1553393.1 hypothetical protein [Butyrivibrio sp.]
MTADKKRIKQNLSWVSVWLCMVFTCLCLSACGGQADAPAALTEGESAALQENAPAAAPEDKSAASQQAASAALPEDGVYSVDFKTDSSMFHVSEACDGKGTLTVKDGEMTLHISLASKNIVNLYLGLAEDAKADGAEILMPTIDTVTYSDGMSEEVHGFDVPVPVLGEEFDLALLGTKGKWYDHKVSVSNPVPTTADKESRSQADSDTKAQNQTTDDTKSQEQTTKIRPSGLADGAYTIEVSLEGGSGKTGITSPSALTVESGIAVARIEWGSPNYDYMVVDGERYEPMNTEGNSVFEIPIEAFDEPITVIADTIAMSKPHEIEYTLTFDGETLSRE